MSIQRVLKAPSGSFFLWGCRGTGKSTWLREVFSDAAWFDLLDEGLYQRFLARPELFGDELRELTPESWVVVDEVQRLPNLLNEVHRAMETQSLRFVLCGSSARKLKRAGVNLLGGRALLRLMHPFLPEELGSEFDIEAALRYGTLPLVWDSEAPEERLRAYTQLYLKEEIQAEALVRNLSGFARFLPIAALFHGQTLNVSSLARDTGVARTTVSGYLDILDETMMTFRLPAYEARLRVRERSHPKLYWSDPGIQRSARGVYGEVRSEERGALFEGLVAQHLRAAIDLYGLADDMHYWSPLRRGNTEVDFLLRRGDQFVAIEAKSGAAFRPEWRKGLRAIEALDGLVRRIIVTPNARPSITEEGIELMSFARLVKTIQQGILYQV